MAYPPFKHVVTHGRVTMSLFTVPRTAPPHTHTAIPPNRTGPSRSQRSGGRAVGSVCVWVPGCPTTTTPPPATSHKTHTHTTNTNRNERCGGGEGGRGALSQQVARGNQNGIISPKEKEFAFVYQCMSLSRTTERRGGRGTRRLARGGRVAVTAATTTTTTTTTLDTPAGRLRHTRGSPSRQNHHIMEGISSTIITITTITSPMGT